MIEDMQVRNLSPVTQRCYVHAVAKFARHFNRSPDRLGLAEIRAYQIHLTSTGISWAGFNVAVCALRFFYGVTLGRAAIVERIPYARKRRQLPVILSADEVVRFFAAVPNLKHRTALMTAYAAGLRVSEVVRLQVRRYRQQPHADPDRAGQGRPGPLRHAVAAAARRAARLLAGNPAGALAVSGPDESRPLDASVLHCGLPQRPRGGEARQARHRPYAAPQLRHPPARSRHRYPHRSRCCSAIAICRRQPATRRSPTPRSATRPARSTG